MFHAQEICLFPHVNNFAIKTTNLRMDVNFRKVISNSFFENIDSMLNTAVLCVITQGDWC